MSSAVIEHETATQRFVLSQDGASALLTYQLQGKQIDFNHTFVPPEFRGKGLAAELVKHGLAWANAQGYQISASCSYVQRFI